MHVLPLPFGHALAVLPRREADLVRREKAPLRVRRGPTHRERLVTDARFTQSRYHV